ncbi:MAG: thioredoxin domain-containing protein [Candidatus Hydrothermarchaeaceae archaeon]
MVNLLKYAIILIAIFLAGCVDSGSDNTSVRNDSAAPLVLTEEELANKTLEYIRETFLKPQGLDGELESIEPFGELYIVNFTFGRGMTQTQTQAYVTREGKLILGQVVDITKPLETQAPPEPTRIDVSIDGDSCLGPEDAPVTIIEFSDYQCPYCAKFWSQTLPQIKAEYIDTGKVKFVYRDYPLTGLGHAYAQKAAEAAECAGEQGKFWEMHDKLFETQGELSSLQKEVSNSTIEGRTIVTVEIRGVLRYFDITDDMARLKGLSQDLGLDTTAFDSCLDSGQMASEVQKDMQDGAKAGVTGTPAFFVNGIFLSGAQPFEVFKQIIDSELAGGASASTVTGTCG